MGLIQKVFGTHSQHELKRIYPIVDRMETDLRCRSFLMNIKR